MAKNNIIKLKKKFKDIIFLSTLTGEGISDLKKKIWENSNLIRIYTEKTKEPMILEKGSTVERLILHLHKKLFENFREAIVNGPSAKFSNQSVGLHHVLEDEDKIKIIVER